MYKRDNANVRDDDFISHINCQSVLSHLVFQDIPYSFVSLILIY